MIGAQLFFVRRMSELAFGRRWKMLFSVKASTHLQLQQLVSPTPAGLPSRLIIDTGDLVKASEPLSSLRHHCLHSSGFFPRPWEM